MCVSDVYQILLFGFSLSFFAINDDKILFWLRFFNRTE